MKRILKSTLLILLSLVFVVCAVACSKPVEQTGLWENATYLKDTELGEGATEIFVDVVAENQMITFTINTDKTNLGDALFEHQLIDDASYFVKMNGMLADYTANEAWWKVCEVTKDENGEEKETALSVGVALTELTSGDHYRVIYTIGF